MSLLQLKHICKSFSGVYANENINLSVEKGEIHALLGENGAGKTTLVNIIFGLYTADSGEILWKGKPADFASPKEAIEAGVGMVQQHFSLVNKMTVLDNIILNLKGNSFFLDRAAARKKLTDLAEKYGLHVNPDALISDLSVGEQQRVEILKALYRNVELLILDEPTGVLTYDCRIRTEKLCAFKIYSYFCSQKHHTLALYFMAWLPLWGSWRGSAREGFFNNSGTPAGRQG